MANEKKPAYGDNTPNWVEVAHLIFIATGLFYLWGLRVNTIVWESAAIFFGVGLFAVITMIIFFVLKLFGYSLFIPVSDKPAFGNRKLVYVIAILAFLVTFFFIGLNNGQTAGIYAIQAPTFQLVDVGEIGQLLLDIYAACFENYAFFVAWQGIIFTVFYYLPKLIHREPNFAFAALMVVILVPISFQMYHTAVYTYDEPAKFAVWAFGLEMSLLMLVFNDVIYATGRHLGNNLGLSIFRTTSLQTFVVNIITSPITWIVGIIIAVILIMRKRGKQ